MLNVSSFADGIKSVKHNAFLMKRALDESNLRAALKHSSAMLNELRTGSLSPKKYYGLCTTLDTIYFFVTI